MIFLRKIICNGSGLGTFLFLFVLNYNCSLCAVQYKTSYISLNFVYFDVPWNYIFSISINQGSPIILVDRNKTNVNFLKVFLKMLLNIGRGVYFCFSSNPLWCSLK